MCISMCLCVSVCMYILAAALTAQRPVALWPLYTQGLAQEHEKMLPPQLHASTMTTQKVHTHLHLNTCATDFQSS